MGCTQEPTDKMCIRIATGRPARDTKGSFKCKNTHQLKPQNRPIAIIHSITGPSNGATYCDKQERDHLPYIEMAKPCKQPVLKTSGLQVCRVNTLLAQNNNADATTAGAAGGVAVCAAKVHACHQEHLENIVLRPAVQFCCPTFIWRIHA